MTTAWKCLTVNEFLTQCNWENIALTTPNNSKVQHLSSLKSWKCLTAQSFFELNNWSGQRIYSEQISHSNEIRLVVKFDITNSTEKFWHCFNWQGNENSTPINQKEEIIEQVEELISSVEEFTLNDLSELF